MSEALIVRRGNQSSKSVIPAGGKTYGIAINTNNGVVTYIDDAEGFSPMTYGTTLNYGSWQDEIVNFFGCRPCFYRNGYSPIYLDPNDYTKTESGETVNWSTGDVMVEFKRTWYKYSLDNYILKFEVSNYDRSDDGFVSTAFISLDDSGDIKDYMYYGAYNTVEGRSLSGRTFQYASDRNTVISSCKRAPGYGLEDWVRLCYIMGLIMLVSKSTNPSSSSLFGSGPSGNTSISTGLANKYGLFGKSSTVTKCFGIENLWQNNAYTMCDGIKIDNLGTISVKICSYGDGNAYSVYNICHSNSYGYLDGTPLIMMPVLDGAAIIPIDTSAATASPWGVRVRFNIRGVIYPGLDGLGPFSLFCGNSNAAFGRLIIV